MLTLCIGPSPGLNREVKILRADWFFYSVPFNVNPKKSSSLLAQWETPWNLDVLVVAGGPSDLYYSVIVNNYNLAVFVTSHNGLVSEFQANSQVLKEM